MCFRTFIRSLARTVTGNLLVSLMRDFLSILIQGQYKMSGVSNDPQQREKEEKHNRKRSII